MDPDQRLWWRLLEDLPGRLGAVHRWREDTAEGDHARGSLHPNPTAVVCLAGTVRVVRQGATCDLRAGEALLISAGVRHEHPPLRRGSICFAQGFLPAWSDVRLGDHARTWSGRLPSEPSRRLLERALACADQAERSRLFAEVIRQALAESVTDHAFDGQAMRRMVDRLWSGIHRGVTVADLVRASGLSRAQAYRLFTAGYGVPPKAAIARNRVWLAEALLPTGLPLAEVAQRCGYPSAATLARAWKQAHGRSPRRSRSLTTSAQRLSGTRTPSSR